MIMPKFVWYVAKLWPLYIFVGVCSADFINTLLPTETITTQCINALLPVKGLKK